MEISERAHEVLEQYWIENKEKKNEWMMEVTCDDPIIEEMVGAGYAKNEDFYLRLTDMGWDEARSCIRRHRLAERLMTDVLDIKNDLIHQLGCKFEHILSKNVEENICTLLGHPFACPHGKPIPQGDCCRQNSNKLRQFVVSLDKCEVMERGTIEHINSREENVINKMSAMGILPGLPIQLMRKTPSYLFRMGESQFAIDKALAQKIHVRRLN